MNHRINLTVAASAVAFPLSVSGPPSITVVPSCAVVSGTSETYPGPYEFTPGPSEQTIPIADMVADQDITLHAIPDDYVGSAVPRRDAGDMSVSGPTVTAAAGYYEESVSQTVASGSATTPSGGIESNPTIAVGSTGLITATVNKTESVTPIVVPGYVSSGTAGTLTFSGTATQQLTTRDSSDLVVLNDTVTVPSGFYPSEAAAGVSPGEVSVPSTTIAATPSISVDANGLITASVNASQSVSPSVSPGWITGGNAGTISASGAATEQLTTQGATTITPTTSTQTAVSAGTYVTGNVDIAAMPNGVRGNGTVSVTTSSTKKRYTMTYPDATSGYYPSSTVANPGYVELTRQTETVTPDETGTTVTPTGSYYWLEQVAVDPIPSNYVGSAIPQNDSSDLTASGATVTAPAGYYANNASKTISSGSVGLPYATKGTVSGNSVNVTPFVTSTTGYITGQTRTGSAVSVSASELVSGTLPITSNGTGIDVTNYAAVDVSVSGGSPNLQTKTKSYTPTESAQSETVTADVGYDGLDEVSVNVGAISSTYVGSGIAQRDSSSLSASGATVTAPAGYYANNATKTVSSGSATAPASISGSSATVSTGTNTLTLSKTVSVTPVVSAGYVSSGTAGNSSVSLTASVTTQGAHTYNPSTSDQTIAAGTYLTGAQTIKKMTLQNKTVTTNGAVTADAGYNGLDTVTVNVSGGGSVQSDVKTVTVTSGTYPTSISFTGMNGEPKMFACRLNANVSSSGSTTYYYIVDVIHAGTTTHGNSFRIGSTRRIQSVTTGFSYTYSGTTLTITSSSADRTALPGSFYPGSYELIYVY